MMIASVFSIFRASRVAVLMCRGALIRIVSGGVQIAVRGVKKSLQQKRHYHLARGEQSNFRQDLEKANNILTFIFIWYWH
jgi:hypothetical protein